jgi:hypothetical protein
MSEPWEPPDWYDVHDTAWTAPGPPQWATTMALSMGCGG